LILAVGRLAPSEAEREPKEGSGFRVQDFGDTFALKS